MVQPFYLSYQLQGLKTEEHEMMKVLINAALSDKAYNKTVELKTCQKKRLSLTTALIGNPKVRMYADIDQIRQCCHITSLFLKRKIFKKIKTQR